MNSPRPSPSAALAPVQFTFRDRAVRTVTVNGNPWFIAADASEVLGLKNSRDALAQLDDDEKGVVLTDTPGGAQEMSTVDKIRPLSPHLQQPQAAGPGVSALGHKGGVADHPPDRPV